MTARRHFLTGSALGLLAACGGGSVAQAPAATAPSCPAQRLVSCYGDSITSGSVAPNPSTPGGAYLAVRPVLRLAQLLGVPCIDHGVPARSALDMLPGWPTTLLAEPAQVLVLRLGAADALGTAPLEQIEHALRTLTAQALAAGRRVVLPGVIHMARRPEWQDRIGLDAVTFADKAERAAHIDRAVAAVARATGAAWVDLRALPFAGAADLADAVHPGQAYSDRCVAAIADAARPFLTSGAA